jgi:hypothetical protein
LRIARYRSICLSTLENTPLNGTKSKAGVGVAAALSDVSVACRMKKTLKKDEKGKKRPMSMFFNLNYWNIVCATFCRALTTSAVC